MLFSPLENGRRCGIGNPWMISIIASGLIVKTWQTIDTSLDKLPGRIHSLFVEIQVYSIGFESAIKTIWTLDDIGLGQSFLQGWPPSSQGIALVG